MFFALSNYIVVSLLLSFENSLLTSDTNLMSEMWFENFSYSVNSILIFLIVSFAEQVF